MTSKAPNLPCQDLINGPKEDFYRICIPLNNALIKCDWKAAKAIIDDNSNIPLVRCSITENGDTPLHVAASSILSPIKVKKFIKSLVGFMEKGDLGLQNNNHDTAFYIAAATGNIEIVKIMMPEKKVKDETSEEVKNSFLLKIHGSHGRRLPLNTAAEYGKYEMVKYLYKYTKLEDECWERNDNRGQLFDNCIKNDMLDIAQDIYKKYKELAHRAQTLQILARKPDAFYVQQTNFLWSIIGVIIWVLEFVRFKKKVPKNRNKAYTLLTDISEAISNLPNNKINDILRGSPDWINTKDKSATERVVQVLQLQELVSRHLDTLCDDTEVIINGQPTTAASQLLRLTALVSKHVVKMHLETQNIIKQDDKQVSSQGNQDLQKLNISEQITRLHVEAHKIVERKCGMEEKTLILKGIVENYITKMRDEIVSKKTYSSRVLFVAAEMGNTIFIIEMIRQYPHLIWQFNDNKQSIFHIAAENRHKDIYSLIYQIGPMKDMITRIIDVYGNNMLHLVGRSVKQKHLQDVIGVALPMQEELLWFKEVENLIHPSFREKKNSDGLTPYELFTKEHKELLTRGEKWMKATASQSMIVATLIVTIVFAVAFTIPGGYNQNNGIPFFKSKAAFMVFVVADAMSLFSSSASISIFLSILTSRYAEHDYLDLLPGKLVFGLVTLFLSIATMTLAFSVSFFVLYNEGVLWVPILIGAFAVMPVFLYVFLQSRLFLNIMLSTYGSSHLFNTKKYFLHSEYPKF